MSGDQLEDLDQDLPFELPPTHEEDQAEDQAEPAAGRLFGAATPIAGGYQPVPVFAVAGVDVASGPGSSGPAAGAIVLDGLSVHWGRDDVLDQADPATASVSLFDPTRRWAMDTERVGQLATLRWSGGLPAPLAGNGSTVFFRGRISTCQPAPATVVYPDGTEVRGAVVTMTLTSILADLANITPTDAWPAETLGARATRVGGLASSILPNTITRAYWQTPQVGPVPAQNQVSLWDHLMSLYDSSGADRYTYWPPDQYAVHLPRRYLTNTRGVGQLWWETGSGTPRAGKGIYARSIAYPRSEAVFGPQALYLDSAWLEMDPDDGVVRGPSSRITRVTVDSVDSGAATPYSARTVTQFTGVSEAVAGVRAARLDTILAWNPYADLAGQDLASFATHEGAAWHLGAPVTWRTAVSGGFEDPAQGGILLYGGEIYSSFFLQRTWLPEFGIRPVFGVIGMTIGYRDGGWELELDLSPVVTDVPQHAITWEEIDDGSAAYEVQWWDGDNPRGMHESLTLDDLGYVARGLAVSTIPPDTGWDTPA